jgi:hypothetical protein
MGHLSRIRACCKAAFALAGTGDLLPAFIPVKIAGEKSATLYLLPVRFAGVKSAPAGTELNALPELTTDCYAAPSASPAESGRGYPPLHADFLRFLNR